MGLMIGQKTNHCDYEEGCGRIVTPNLNKHYFKHLTPKRKPPRASAPHVDFFIYILIHFAKLYDHFEFFQI
jgi:hypothetical protein